MFGVKINKRSMLRASGHFGLEDSANATIWQRHLVRVLNGAYNLLKSIYKTVDRVKAWANSWFSEQPISFSQEKKNHLPSSGNLSQEFSLPPTRLLNDLPLRVVRHLSKGDEENRTKSNRVEENIAFWGLL
jgi:hypothetical protein